MRSIPLRYQKNVRDFGGLTGIDSRKIKKGRIYRGGFLGRVSEDDIRIIDSLHLTDIADFRGTHEFQNRPDYRFKGVTYHNFPTLEENIKKEQEHLSDANLLWFVTEFTSGHDHMMETYRNLVSSDIAIKAYKEFFKLLTSKDDGVFYFHCSQGKDRAGLAAYFIEKALGVSEEEAREDYLITNLAMYEKIENLRELLKNEPFYNKTYDGKLVDVFLAKLDYLDNALKEINAKFENLDNYLRNVLEIDIDKMRELYLEEA